MILVFSFGPYGAPYGTYGRACQLLLITSDVRAPALIATQLDADTATIVTLQHAHEHCLQTLRPFWVLAAVCIMNESVDIGAASAAAPGELFVGFPPAAASAEGEELARKVHACDCVLCGAQLEQEGRNVCMC